jgi:hypothetical protein
MRHETARANIANTSRSCGVTWSGCLPAHHHHHQLVPQHRDLDVLASCSPIRPVPRDARQRLEPQQQRTEVPAAVRHERPKDRLVLARAVRADDERDRRRIRTR